jgi:uncharacterized protein YndB with AHSA1/START domain
MTWWVAATVAGLAGQATGDRVKTLEVTKPSDRTIVLTRSFAAGREKVFDALTKQDQVPRWFQPARMSLLAFETDFRPGGTYRYIFQRPNGARLEVRGAYQEVDPPHRWVYTETYDFSPLQLLVTSVLEAAGGKTVLKQTILYASKEARDGDFAAVAGSATETYATLERYLESVR